MLELPRAEEVLHDLNLLGSFPITQSSMVARTTKFQDFLDGVHVLRFSVQRAHLRVTPDLLPSGTREVD